MLRQLPENGPVELEGVRLPAGRRTPPHRGRTPVAWICDEPVPDAGRIWEALSQAHPQTGLAPILLDGLDGSTSRPWDEGEFADPEDPGQADGVDVSEFLAGMWDDEETDPDFLALREPYTGPFPGLAPAEHRALTPAERRSALDSALWDIRSGTSHRRPAAGERTAARIGLVSAARPADVLAAIGWGGIANYNGVVPGLDAFLVPLTAVLRSWEDRFGARVIDVGFADLRLLVERPPRTLRAAQHVAAEHFALADEAIAGWRDIPNIAARLVNAPVWTFWWD